MSRLSRHAHSVLLATIALSVLLTCSDDGPTNSDNGGNVGSPSVTVADTNAPSGSWVPLTGLPSDSGYYGIVTSTAKADDTGYAAVVRSDSGDFLITPLNPSDPIGGGTVEVVITNGAKATTEPITLVLDSLPPAPNEFNAVVTLLQDILTEQLRIAGLTRDSLVYASASDVPLSQVPFVLLYSAIDSPDNPNSLRALADGPIPYLNNTAIDIDLLDRLMGQTDLRTYFEEKLAGLDTVSVSFVPDYTTDSRVGQVSSASACIPPPDYGITTCGALSNAMRQQFALELSAVSVEERLDAAVISGALVATNLLPSGPAISGAIGAVLWSKGVVNEGFQNMLPSELIDAATSFDPSQQDFPEDFTEPGEWTQFQLSAQSKGWTLDKVALESVMQVLGASAAGDAIGAVQGELAERAENAMKGYIQDQFSGQVINELTDQSGLIQICPNIWSGINCVGTDFSTVTSLNGILSINETEQKYEPTEVGDDFLKIETKNVFGGGNSAGTTIPIKASRIELFIDPFQAEADTLETIEFSVRVENAEDTEVEWMLEGGGSLTPNGEAATVVTPVAAWDPPLKLKARSLANTGLREGKVESDPREDEAEIRHKGEGIAIITPGSYCLRPGEDQDFTVTYTGSSIQSVEWEIDPPGVGSISGSGDTITYIAPNHPAGNVTLSATVNDTSTGYAYVDVSACICNWAFSGLGNAGVISGSGEWATARFTGALVVDMDSDTSQGFNPPFVSLISYTATGEGTFPVDAMGYVVSDTVDWGIADPDQLLPILEITEYVENDYIQGRAYGTLSRMIEFNADETIYEYITFDLTFRAEFFNLDRPQCIDD